MSREPQAVHATNGDRTSTFSSWLREPLLHFVFLGIVLFAVDQAFFAPTDELRTITIDAGVDLKARELFKASRGREPTSAELYALRRVWLDNEVLYREGLRMQVDRGDPAIRERVIFKALSVIDGAIKAPAYDEATLRLWFDKNHTRYDEPARYDFEEAVLPGDADEAAKRAFVAELNAGALGDSKAGLRIFKARPHTNLVQSYGEAFAAELASSTPDQWRAYSATDGVHVMRLKSVTTAKPASFDALKGIVLHDWTDATMAELRSNAVKALAMKYTISTGSTQ